MGGRAGGGARGASGDAYASLNRAQKIAVNRALSNEINRKTCIYAIIQPEY